MSDDEIIGCFFQNLSHFNFEFNGKKYLAVYTANHTSE